MSTVQRGMSRVQCLGTSADRDPAMVDCFISSSETPVTERAVCTWDNACMSAAVNCNCNSNICIEPRTRRPRTHYRVNPYPGAGRQNETEMFSDHDETSPPIEAVSAPSIACSMLAVQQQKRLCHKFVDVSAARRGFHTMKHAV